MYTAYSLPTTIYPKKSSSHTAKTAVTFQSSHTQINQHFCWLQKSQHKLILQPQTHQASCCHSCGHKQRSELYVLILHHSAPGLAPCLAQTQNQHCLQQTQSLGPPGLWCSSGSHSELCPLQLQAGVNKRDHDKANTSRSSLIQNCILCIPNHHHHQTPHPSMCRHFPTCRPRTPGNPEIILQRVIKKSESVVNGLKLALWGSMYSLKSIFNKRKRRFTWTPTAQRVHFPEWQRSETPSCALSCPHPVPVHC